VELLWHLILTYMTWNILAQMVEYLVMREDLGSSLMYAIYVLFNLLLFLNM